MIRSILLSFLAASAWGQTPSADESVISLNNFQNCGYVSRFAPNKISPECFQSINNAVLDQDYSILRRNGYAKYNTVACTGNAPIRGMWPFYGTDGSQYVILQSSVSMYSSKGDGTCTQIAGLTNLSSTAQMSCVQGMGYLWCADGVDQPFNTNVTTTNTIVNAPVGKYIGFFRNRILLAGVSGFLTNIYLSGELDGTNWSVPVVQTSTSPAILNISGTNDGQSVSCMMGEFQNGYYIGRNYDTYLLSGYDLTDFSIKKVDQQIGCMDNNSPQMVNNVLMWLSHRGIEGLSGTQINWLSYPIDPTIAVIIQAAGNSQALTLNGNNFTTGNLIASGPGAPISATIVPGNLTVSSSVFVDTSSSTFLNGTFSNTSIYGNSIGISISTNVILEGNFNTTTNWTAYTTAGNNPCAIASASDGATVTCGVNSYKVNCPNGASKCAFITGVAGSCSFGVSQDNGLCIRAGDSNTVIENVRVSSGNNISVDLSPYFNTNISTSIILMLDTDGSITGLSCGTPPSTIRSYVLQNNSIPLGSNVVLDTNRYCAGTNGATPIFTFSNIRVSSYTSPGTYTSTAFNTSFSTPILSSVALNYSSNSISGVTFQQENSSDGVSWSSPSSLTNGSFATRGKKYWRYLANFTTTSGTTTAISNGSTLSAETTGYYISPCINTTGVTTWGVMSVDAVNNGGSFSFWLSTGSSCGAVTATTATWNTQTPNSIITVSTASFIATRVLFNIDSATQTPILNDIGFNWNSGASRPPIASAQYLNKYFLFYTTSQVSGAHNDHSVVYDQNGHWQLYDDVSAASSALYLNKLFIGDSNSTGLVYLFDSGSDDAGNPYNFSFTTPDLDGGDPMMLKNFNRAYLILGAPSPTTLSSSMSCNYTLSGSSVSYSIGTVNLNEAPEQGGYFVAKLPFPTGQPSTGQWINLSCSNSGTSGPLRIYGIRLVYTKTNWP